MFVRRVANQPSSFMLLFLIIFNIPISNSIPSMSKMLLLYKILNKFFSSFLYAVKLLSMIFFPSKLERLQIIEAHFQLFPSMIDLMKLTKLRRSHSSSLMTIPTSMRLSFTFQVHFLTIQLIIDSYYRLALQRFFKDWLSIRSQSSLPYSWCIFPLRYSQIYPKNEVDCLVTQTRMLPPWQSAWIKLFFISIQKKVDAPNRAITALS